jgi:hypothetical protein
MGNSINKEVEVVLGKLDACKCAHCGLGVSGELFCLHCRGYIPCQSSTETKTERDCPVNAISTPDTDACAPCKITGLGTLEAGSPLSSKAWKEGVVAVPACRKR